MTEEAKVAVFIDVANNGGCLNLYEVLNQIGAFGQIEEARAYGDFRQDHLAAFALELYAKGIEMVHCPSWPNGDGMKRSDDRLLEKEVRDMLATRPSISTYILVTSDADIIPTCQSPRRQNKRVILFSQTDETLGWVLRSCGFEMRNAPPKEPHVQRRPEDAASADAGNGRCQASSGSSDRERLVREMDRLERTSRYVCFTNAVGRISQGDASAFNNVQRQLNELVREGVVENYSVQIPAIRLNRNHPLVRSALDEVDKLDQSHEMQPVPGWRWALIEPTGRGDRRKRAGAEPHVVVSCLGPGNLWTCSVSLEFENSDQMQVIVDNAPMGLPTLFPGCVVLPGQRALGFLSSGGPLLSHLAAGLKKNLRPLKWACSYGGDPHSESGTAFLLVGLNGADLQRLFGGDDPPEWVVELRQHAIDLFKQARKNG